MSNTPLSPGCTHNGAQEVKTARCSQAACDSCEGGSVCCCRVIESESIDDIQCIDGVSRPSVFNATLCGCSVCDDIPVTVTMTVFDRVSLDRIRAAQVYRVDDGDLLQPMGITDNSGRFIFVEPAATRSITLLILAADFMQYRSLPIALLPSRTTVSLEIKLIPIMNIPAGLGGSAITLRLGPTAVISAPAGAFRTIDGNLYEDIVNFNGMVMTSSDENDFDGIPSTDFEVYDSETGQMVPFGAFLVTFVEFTTAEGDRLLSDVLRLAVSILSTDGTVPDLFLAVYNQSSEQWMKTSSFTPLPQFRKKRQGDPPPVVLENPDIPASVFMAVASSESANCWLQGRVFEENGPPTSGPFISLESRVDISGTDFLFRFGTNTGSFVNSATFSTNSLCLPVHCTGISSASLHSREGFDTTTMRLLPVDFPLETFNMSEAAPIQIGTLFLFDELVLSTPEQPKPFYSDFATCQTNAIESNNDAVPSDYFRFDIQQEIPTPVITDTCFVKIQIMDCFDGNSVTVTSIDPVSGGITRTDTIFVTDPEETTTEIITTTDTMTTSSGTLPPETTTEFMETTTEEPFVCDSTTAVSRTVCLPHVCGNVIQLIVRPAAARGLSGLCNVTNQAVLIPFISDPPIQDAPFVVRTNLLISDDYNQPILGLYHEEGSSVMSTMFAEEMCNFGGMSTSPTVDPDMGVAVTFSCVE